MKSLEEMGYETPTPIQEKIIPHILTGRDVLGQAQTGTGKTAAFALPLLSLLDIKLRKPQVLVLTPTRELAIQVAKFFEDYARHLEGFETLAIYGGQSYEGQFRKLKRGVHVIVGTPGRLMDHMRRGTVDLKHLNCLVLDEADEMLRMGFIEDVEWILEQTPSEHQTTLFSATMPAPIRKISQKYLKDPVSVTIKATAADTVDQNYLLAKDSQKFDILVRLLEVENADGIIVFVRTKNITNEVAAKLEAFGYPAAALNGDLSQNQRECTIKKLKNGKIDILIATDVAARGLDVDRISHIINYDAPFDIESYIHRIGRTGRAGRTGKAVLFVTPREKRFVQIIEKKTKQKIKEMEIPSLTQVNTKRITRFKDKITDTLTGNFDFFRKLIEEYQQESEVDTLDIAAVLAKLWQGKRPLLLTKQLEKPKAKKEEKKREKRTESRRRRGDENMESYRIEVGKKHGAKIGHIVGAIANEANIDSKHIGRIEIYDSYSLVDLPKDLPRKVLQILGRAYVAGRRLKISHSNNPATEPKQYRKKDKKRKKDPNRNARIISISA